MKRVLVTGASGFVGRQVLPALLQRGYEVHALSRRPVASAEVRWHAGDLLEPSFAPALLARLRPDRLLHLAWYAEHGKYWTAAENYRWVGATLELLRAFVDCGGQRAVAVGTCAEYDWRYGYCDESLTPCAPATAYGRCKLAAGTLFLAQCRERGIAGTWVRLFNLYGPHEHPARLVASVALSLLRGEEALCSHGRQLRDFTAVGDAADALAAVLDTAVDGVVNLGSGQAVTVGEVARRLAEQLGRTQALRLNALRSADTEPAVLLPATLRLNREVGWRTATDLDGGLAQAIDWWRMQLAAEARN